MKFLISTLALCTLLSVLHGQCPPADDYKLEDQDEVDDFCAMYGSGPCTITGKLQIDYKNGPVITDLSCLSFISEVTDELKVKDCDLTDLDGLQNITAVGGNLKFENITSLTNLNGLNPALTSVGGELKVKDCNSLTDVSGLSNITTIGGNFKFEDNTALTTISNLPFTSVGGEFKISGCTNLTTVSNLGNNATVAGNFKIENNPSLSTISNIDVISVGGDFKIKNNDMLTSLSGFSSLTSADKVIIENNDALQSLDGLQNLTTITSELTIIDNPQIGSGGAADCISLSGICNSLVAPATPPATIDYSGNHSSGDCDVTDNDVVSECEALAALPVKLISFEASVRNQKTYLAWSTATELENDKFVIERSTDGKSFEPIGEIEGMGTTTQRHDYEFTDNNPAFGLLYYRLLQLDFDGKYAYSPVVIVSNFANELTVKLHPVPANTIMQVNVSTAWVAGSSLLINIYSLEGRLMKQVQSNENPTSVDVEALPGGMYMVETLHNGRQYIQRIVKQ